MNAAAILLAASMAGCAAPRPAPVGMLATGEQRIGREQIEAEHKDPYTRVMRFQAWVLGLTRFEF